MTNYTVFTADEIPDINLPLFQDCRNLCYDDHVIYLSSNTETYIGTYYDSTDNPDGYFARCY